MTFEYITKLVFSSSENRTPECKRHLETTLTESDQPAQIARELANHALISVHDIDIMTIVIQVIPSFSF